jgi:hypothetical protein
VIGTSCLRQPKSRDFWREEPMIADAVAKCPVAATAGSVARKIPSRSSLTCKNIETLSGYPKINRKQQ